MGPPERSSTVADASGGRSPRSLRASILQAAGAILEETGSDDAVTLRAIARRAGITAPAIYGHFVDRSEILRTVVETTFAELFVAMDAATTGQSERMARLMAVCRAYLDFAEQRPHHYRILFERHRVAHGNLHGTDEPNTDVRAMVGADAFGVLLDAVTACSGAGSGTHHEDPILATNRVWIGLHGQASLLASLPWHPWPDRDRLTEDLVTRLVGPPPQD